MNCYIPIGGDTISRWQVSQQVSWPS